MAGNEFTPGDLVQLKAGGPKMVIEELDHYRNRIKCSWFAGAKHNSEFFAPEALRPFEEE